MNHSKMLKPTILSVALLTIMAAAAVSPALAKIGQAFPDVDKTLIKLILTLPCLVIIPFSLFSGWLAARMSKKKIILIGLVIYIIAGIGAGFAQSITQLLIIRGIFGIGVGLIMPLSTTLIASFFDGEERTKMMGLYSSITSLGGVVFQAIAGMVAVISWRYSFGVYGLAIITALLTIFWLPEPPRQKITGKKVKVKLPFGIYGLAVLSVLLMIAFFAVPTNLALFIESERPLFASERPLFESRQDLVEHLESGTISEKARNVFKNNGIMLSKKAGIEEVESQKEWNIIDGKHKYIVKKENTQLIIYSEGLGRPAIAGYALSVMTLASAVTGFTVNAIFMCLGAFAAPLGILVMAIGFGVLGEASSLWMIFLSMVIIGLGAGAIMPALFLKTQRIVSKNALALSMAIVGSCIYLGQFISPIALKAIASLAGQDTLRFRFILIAFGLGIAALIAFVNAIYSRKGKKNV